MTLLPKIIEALSLPQAYPHPADPPIKVVQTQMSVVFLTGRYAYKVKKPVNLGYLDYTTLEKRREFCHREVELNRRLCPKAYLEIVPITRESGTVVLGGRGEPEEYAVKMRQLPGDRMMDQLLLAGKATPHMVRAVAKKLAAFHAAAETNKYINSFGELCTIMVNTDENFSQTEGCVGRCLNARQYQRIKDYTEAFIRDHAALMHDRIDQGRIRDCHGDLHAAHVCFSDGICIYDCIEFTDRFRYSDVASEVAFLAMDLDRYDRPDLSRLFVNAYVKASGDPTIMTVLPFYKCYRAYVRGKVESFKLDDKYLSEIHKQVALEASRRYFELAYSYARPPVLIIMVGLVGTGKTTVANAIAQRLGAAVISTDVVRKTLAGIPLAEHRFDEMNTGIYSPAFSRKTYNAAFDHAGKLLARGKSVVMDATFLQRSSRKRARDLAQRMSSAFVAIECILPEDVARARLEKRLTEASPSDGRWEIYVRQKASFRPASELPEDQHVIVDTSGPWIETIDKLAERFEQ